MKIINHLGIKKPSSGEIPTYVFKKCDFVQDTATVSVKETLKTKPLHDSLKCASYTNIQKVDPFDKKNYRLVSIVDHLVRTQTLNHLAKQTQ